MGDALNIYGAALGTVLAVWGIVWKMTEATKKETLEAAKEAKEKVEDARSTLYRRFDEQKEHVERNFVSDKIFTLVNNQMRQDLSEIKLDIKVLLKKANSQ